MGTDVFLLTKPAGSNSIQRACSQATQKEHTCPPSPPGSYAPAKDRNIIDIVTGVKQEFSEKPVYKHAPCQIFNDKEAALV
jgi:hypothetical protein